jgi:hypothetical protein
VVPFIKPPIFLVKAPVVTTGLVGESITPKPAKTGLGLNPTTIPDAVTAGKLFGAIVPASVTADDVIFDFETELSASNNPILFLLDVLSPVKLDILLLFVLICASSVN